MTHVPRATREESEKRFRDSAPEERERADAILDLYCEYRIEAEVPTPKDATEEGIETVPSEELHD